MMIARVIILTMLSCLCLVPSIAFAQYNSDDRSSAENAEVIEKEILHLEEVGRQKALRGEKQWDDLMAAGSTETGFGLAGILCTGFP